MTVGTTFPRKILNNGKEPCEPFIVNQVIAETASKIVFALDNKGDRDDLSNILNDKDTISKADVKNGDTIRFSRVGGKRSYGPNLCDQEGGEGRVKADGVAFASSYLCTSVTKPENGFKANKDS